MSVLIESMLSTCILQASARKLPLCVPDLRLAIIAPLSLSPRPHPRRLNTRTSDPNILREYDRRRHEVPMHVSRAVSVFSQVCLAWSSSVCIYLLLHLAPDAKSRRSSSRTRHQATPNLVPSHIVHRARTTHARTNAKPPKKTLWASSGSSNRKPPSHSVPVVSSPSHSQPCPASLSTTSLRAPPPSCAQPV